MAPAMHSRRWLRLGLMLLVLAYLPSLIGYAVSLWQSEHHRFFPLALVAAVLLANRSLLEWAEPLPAGAPRLAAVLAALALILFILAALWWSPWFGYLSFLLLLSALLAFLGGISLLKSLAPPLLMLAVLIRLPLNWDTAFTLWLRGLAVAAGSGLLEILRIPHLVSGLVIDLPGHRLLVAEACSGVISIFAVLAFALFYGLWKRRSPGHIALIMLTGVLAVWFGNALRIGGGAFLQYRFGFEVLTGRWHEAIGVLLLAGYALLVFSADHLLLCARRRYEPDPDSLEELPFWPYAEVAFQDGRRALSDMVRALTRNQYRSCAVLVGLFVIVGGAQSVRAWNNYVWLRADSSLAAFQADTPFALPDALAGWQRVSGGPSAKPLKTWLGLEAVYSKYWTYRKDALLCTVALSYPYTGHHDLSVCYLNNGWQLGAPNLQAEEANGLRSIMELDLRKRPLACGYLLYSTFTGDGQWRRLDATKARLRIAPEDHEPTCQVQLLITGSSAFSPANKADARRLFLAARQILARQAGVNAAIPAPRESPAAAALTRNSSP